jgi:hypothetical protein
MNIRHTHKPLYSVTSIDLRAQFGCQPRNIEAAAHTAVPPLPPPHVFVSTPFVQLSCKENNQLHASCLCVGETKKWANAIALLLLSLSRSPVPVKKRLSRALLLIVKAGRLQLFLAHHQSLASRL